MHPSVKRKLAAYFAEPNLRLYALLGRDFRWAATSGSKSSTSSYMGAGGIADVGGEEEEGGSDIKAGSWEAGGEGSSGPAGSVSISIAAISAGRQV
jgi:hypothetical protein